MGSRSQVDTLMAPAVEPVEPLKVCLTFEKGRFGQGGKSCLFVVFFCLVRGKGKVVVVVVVVVFLLEGKWGMFFLFGSRCVFFGLVHSVNWLN